MLTREEHLESCTACLKRKFNPQKGIVCSLTEEWADFERECEHYEEDVEASARKKRIQEAKDENDLEKSTGGLSRVGIKNQAIAGVIIMIGGLVWLFLGITELNRIFFYAIILFGFGVVIFVRGLIVEKRKRDKAKQHERESDLLDR